MLRSWIGCACCALLFSSCLNDHNETYRPQESWGTISGNPTSFVIHSDVGNTLQVVENRDPSFEFKDQQRVVASLQILSEKGINTYDVAINAIKPLLTKSPVYPSQLTPAQQDSLGTNPIEVYQAWFGANRYLNLEFMIWSHNPQIRHFINLAVDETQSTDETCYVTLRHNAFNDVPRYAGGGRVSFDLAQILPPEKEQILVVIEWHNYDGTRGRASGYFRRHTSPDQKLWSQSTQTLPSASIE
ncbi:MAG: NigD-like C-terminal domain-containing protein [Alistipes sp.]|nr:NigD-like C-terminal domain-containing protein [Alistipes sp.]